MRVLTALCTARVTVLQPQVGGTHARSFAAPALSTLMDCFTHDLIAASIYDEHSVGPSFRPMCTRCCFTVTRTIQVCSKFYWARVFIINTRSGGRAIRAGGSRIQCRPWALFSKKASIIRGVTALCTARVRGSPTPGGRDSCEVFCGTSVVNFDGLIYKL